MTANYDQSIFGPSAFIEENVGCLGDHIFFCGSIYMAVVKIKPFFVIRVLRKSCVMTCT